MIRSEFRPGPAPLLVLALLIPACKPESPGAASSGGPSATEVEVVPPEAPPEPSTLKFRDVTLETGIAFVHESGNDSQKFFPASLGSGVAMFDYDGDGKLDLYFASTRNLPMSAPNQAMGNKLYRNLGDLKFADVTEVAGVGYRGFCHGVAVGDVNDDGRPDLYLTNYGGNILYLNNGDGTFRDASRGSGADLEIWTSGAAFLDYDGDGKLDLYVSCYGQWTDDGAQEFCGENGHRLFCSPYSIRPQRHYLFRGHGDGTFEETTENAGVLRRDGRGLGVIAADIDRDGLTDLFVANDGCPNFLFRNRGDGTFEDLTESSGAGIDATGLVQGSMGLDIQDLDGDGLPELFVTNFRGQSNALDLNLDGRNFQDVSAQAGIVRDSLANVGWGCSLGDFDNDGTPDMMVVNGEVDDNLRDFGQEIDYEQPVVVMRGLGRGRFARVKDPGPFFTANHAGRGAAFGDLDDDGDLDVVINLMDKKPAVLANESPNPANWIRLSLEGRPGNREAIGASVEVHAGGRLFQRSIKGGDSFLSVNDRRALVGLGAIDRVDRVEVLWPGGRRTVLEAPAVNQTHRMLEPPGGEAK